MALFDELLLETSFANEVTRFHAFNERSNYPQQDSIMSLRGRNFRLQKNFAFWSRHESALHQASHAAGRENGTMTPRKGCVR